MVPMKAKNVQQLWIAAVPCYLASGSRYGLNCCPFGALFGTLAGLQGKAYGELLLIMATVGTGNLINYHRRCTKTLNTKPLTLNTPSKSLNCRA